MPFDRSNESVLGGSGDPYVSKPARIAEISAKSRKDQKDKTGYDQLTVALQYLEQNPDRARDFLRCILCAVRARLENVRGGYPLPKRASAAHCASITKVFLDERSGGLRMQAVAVALFQTIGARFNLFSDVQSANVNAADVATGQVADLECKNSSGEIVLAVEVKDRQLTLVQTQEKVPAIREKGISEFLFLVQGGVSTEDIGAVEEIFRKEFASGQNLYVSDFVLFFDSCLVLFGEPGRHAFLRAVGEALDNNNADIAHRRAWRDLLNSL